MHASFAPTDAGAVPLQVIETAVLDTWLESQTGPTRNWIGASGFSARLGSVLTIPDAEGRIAQVVAGYGDAQARARGRFHLAAAAAALPEGVYRLHGLPTERAEEEALGWLLAHYAFDRYRTAPAQPHGPRPAKARLIAPDGADARRIQAMAAGEWLTRDLINTPACDMGPEALDAACNDLAQAHGAQITVIAGDGLPEARLPLVHIVGRAGAQAPRLIDMRWGDRGPAVTLVGKGVCFDTGGLNLKPGSSMGLMKKDMGGAATVLGLARMIMTLELPVRLRVLIPAVENAIGPDAFRPGDILTARDGTTIEVNNTDAEGRLVLADALVLAAEGPSDLTVSMATLTGAARVAVGPDLAPFYTDDDALAAAISAGGAQLADPVWRMPFHAPYEPLIEPGIADLDNAPAGGFAGSITAALFLRRFAGAARYAHFDIYGWTQQAAPARPKGGVGQGARALLAVIEEMCGPCGATCA